MNKHELKSKLKLELLLSNVLSSKSVILLKEKCRSTLPSLNMIRE